jgi:hypothetical protein
MHNWNISTNSIKIPKYVLCCMGMKLYNDQRNAQVLNLFIYLILPYMF